MKRREEGERRERGGERGGERRGRGEEREEG